MKAVLCREFGPPAGLALGEVPAPRPGRGEVLIRVEAAAVNFPDTLIIQGRYQAKPAFPFAPGANAAFDTGQAVVVQDVTGTIYYDSNGHAGAGYSAIAHVDPTIGAAQIHLHF